MQGLYGPFTIAERVVQKIWLRRDFAADRAVLLDGRKLEIRSPGTWNLLGGPDFRGARLSVGGREITGDIEVHFHASDWRAHGHETDPAYDNVMLHVVMFPPAEAEKPARRRDAGELPTLVLLPILHRSLEEYASDDALEHLTARDAAGWIAELMARPDGELRQLLLDRAARRWAMKRHFAELRIQKLGWAAAAHHTALEILGYRHNRAAMLSVATRHPLEEWAAGLDTDDVYQEGAGQWQLQGVRPANHPRRRLRQYQDWIAGTADWPERLYQLSAEWSCGDRAADYARIASRSPRLQGLADLVPTKLARQTLGLKYLREALAQNVTGGMIGGTRLDTLICDGLLPLVAIRAGIDLFPVWFHWFMGDVPREVRRALRETGMAGQGTTPLCHGWGQGLLGWLLDRDARASG